MSRLKDLDGVIQDLRDIAARANDAANWLGEVLLNAQADEDECAVAGDEVPVLTLEEVRGRLAEIAEAGHTDDVRALIRKYGAGKLSDLEPACYPALLQEAMTMLKS